jgi:hypothetical protein
MGCRNITFSHTVLPGTHAFAYQYICHSGQVLHRNIKSDFSEFLGSGANGANLSLVCDVFWFGFRVSRPVADLDHFVAGLIEQLVGFGPSFHRPRLPPEWPFGNLVFGDKLDQVGDQSLAEFCGACREDNRQPVVEPVDGPLEARVPASRGFPAVHQGAQEVVGDDADDEFAPDHGRAAAGEHGHSEGGFEIVDEQLHLPAIRVEGAGFLRGHPPGIGHGACEVDLRRPEPGCKSLACGKLNRAKSPDSNRNIRLS